MLIDGHHLGYCTNVHPGESLDEIDTVLRQHVAEVKRRLSPDQPFGLGLRLGNTAAQGLDEDPAALARLASTCDALGFYVFTVNGFPYGDFAADAVKAEVYAPNWLHQERVAYTLRVARALAALPGPTERTISTVAGGFGPRTSGLAEHRQIARHLAIAAEGLAEIADRTGVHITLCLEPEPWTTLERTDGVIRFFSDHVLPLSHADHLGLCYDCCHQAVYFEDPAESLRSLAAAGVKIGKIQVSSALHIDTPRRPEARAALQAFNEPRYLHQVVGKPHEGPLLRALDLPDVADPDTSWLDAEAWRCHFHVPIWWQGDGVLGTTRNDWMQAVKTAVAEGLCRHLEIETYSWGVIPESERQALEGGDLHACVASEFDALLKVLGAR
ncbi:MAG: metabolite traffic protein EboE [Bradymonadia bacterium]